jgi:hypothetical protein
MMHEAKLQVALSVLRCAHIAKSFHEGPIDSCSCSVFGIVAAAQHIEIGTVRLRSTLVTKTYALVLPDDKGATLLDSVHRNRCR